MRGKADRTSSSQVPAGITPAYAGKSLCLCSQRQACQDHPRLCGEKFVPPSAPLMPLGSPPPMRGKANDLPAAGLVGRDHPRLCGEKLHAAHRTWELLGSPPPMRGKGICRRTIFGYRWITPAYAGKSICHSDFTLSCWDHPRLCGEKVGSV